MELTKKEAFIKQLAVYIRDQDKEKAYDLAGQFVKKFPGEMASHFLFAKAAFDSGRFEEAKLEGRKAFNMSKDPKDLLATALLTSAAYLQLKEYQKGYDLLRDMEKKADSEGLQTALIAFSLALKDDKGAF
jgi:cytochrome c-type biogenesis protein CcmH/NrfG